MLQMQIFFSDRSHQLVSTCLQMIILMLENPGLPARERQHEGLSIHILRSHLDFVWPLRSPRPHTSQQADL